ncbi:MAG: radical SAM protein [Candidatus Heimdallarchaeota archaeon]|nr:radical SAM protein [Candidatus Heimdallarchaeota archaeon]
MKPQIDESRCTNCNYCKSAIKCPGEENCTACGACIDACPQLARSLVKEEKQPSLITCTIDHQTMHIPSQQTVLQVLESLGFSPTRFPTNESKEIFTPCRTGGCYSCAVLINGQLEPSCITPVMDGMIIKTDVEKERPKRIVSGFQGHSVGGVGTPKNLSPRGSFNYLEVACFSAGCLYRCSTCQNWNITYLSRATAKTPLEVAKKLTMKRKTYQVNRMAISGGESTLNRKWLIEFVQNLRKLNPDQAARIHIDTNAAILTPEYIDELIAAGMTDIGPDLKGIHLKTFMEIIQVKNKELARQYLETSWNAVKYILDNYPEKVFIGVGIPYNEAFMTFEELSDIGNALVKFDPKIQVTALDYRPEFRARNLERPTLEEMLRVKEVLMGTGLKNVICQTPRGHIK